MDFRYTKLEKERRAEGVERDSNVSIVEMEMEEYEKMCERIRMRARERVYESERE